MGVGSTTLGFGWSTGYIYFTLAKARRVTFSGRLQPWVSGKDIVLELLRRWGAKQAQGMAVELVDAYQQLRVADRNTIAHMLAAALVVRAARQRGATRAAKEFVVFPGSGGVGLQIEQRDPRLGGESIADVFRSVGGQIRQSWCGPCFGQGPDALTPGQRAITSFNRNWQNRMGLGGEGYLASPAVVAASAMVGYMAPPSELGLKWNPEEFGV